MRAPAFLRVFAKDIIDFFTIMVVSCLITALVYQVSPQYHAIEMSFYFFEQFIELFFEPFRGWIRFSIFKFNFIGNARE